MRFDLGCGKGKERVANLDSWSAGRGWKDLDTTTSLLHVVLLLQQRVFISQFPLFVGAPLAKTGEFVDHYQDDGAQEEVFIE